MARSTEQIKNSITAAFIGNATISSYYGLTPGKSFDDEFSAVSLENIIFSIVAYAIWVLESLLDIHVGEVRQIIADTKAHTVRWYASKAKLFQYGYDLVEDQDYYDNSALTAAQIAASRIVNYAAAAEVSKGLRIKVATVSGGDLAPLTNQQLTAFAAYMERVKDAGVRLYISSSAADSLKLKATVYYNPLVLDAAGARLDGTGPAPVPDAVNAFLKSQPYNGLFVVARLVDALQQVDGVVIPHITEVKARFGTKPYNDTPVEYLPDAGYLRIVTPSDLQITYLPHEPI
jgi:hypothetical protein